MTFDLYMPVSSFKGTKKDNLPGRHSSTHIMSLIISTRNLLSHMTDQESEKMS